MAVDLVEIEPVQLTFDYSEYSPELAASLERHAVNMEGFTKRYANSMGKELAEAKAEIHAEKQTGWAKWVEGRLGITVQHADRCIAAYKKSEHLIQILPPVVPPSPNLPAESEPERASLADVFDPVAHAIPTAYLPIESPALTEHEASLAGYRGYERWQEAQKWEEKRTESAEQAREKHDAHVMRVMGSSESPEWYTPQEIVQLSIALLGEIDLDPCSNSHEAPNVPAHNHYTKEDDGLSQPWSGKVYLNPPYGSEIGKWIDKLVGAYIDEQVEEAIALLPARIDTNWFQPLYDFPMCNIRGRLQFENAIHNAPFPSVIVYLGFREADFIKVFKDCGPVMRRIG